MYSHYLLDLLFSSTQITHTCAVVLDDGDDENSIMLNLLKLQWNVNKESVL